MGINFLTTALDFKKFLSCKEVAFHAGQNILNIYEYINRIFRPCKKSKYVEALDFAWLVGD